MAFRFFNDFNKMVAILFSFLVVLTRWPPSYVIVKFLHVHVNQQFKIQTIRMPILYSSSIFIILYTTLISINILLFIWHPIKQGLLLSYLVGFYISVASICNFFQ